MPFGQGGQSGQSGLGGEGGIELKGQLKNITLYLEGPKLDKINSIRVFFYSREQKVSGERKEKTGNIVCRGDKT